MNKQLNNFNKLILFNFSQLFNLILFWILFSLCVISQPLIILIIYFIDNSKILSLSLIIILVPLILMFIYMVYQINILIQDNKTNSIEYKLICSRYSKSKIMLSRMLVIFIMILFVSLIQDLFLIFLILVNLFKISLALFISNTFINPFVLLLLLSILILIALKSNKVKFTMMSILVAVISLLSSFVTRIFVVNREIKFDYNPENSSYKYIRLINKPNENILFIDNKTSNLSYITEQMNYLIHKINYSSFINNFIPSEWLLSFYSSLFIDIDFNFEFNNLSPYSLLSIKVTNKNISQLDSDYLQYYEIRPNDINFLNLKNDEYLDILLTDISKIIDKYDFAYRDLLVLNIYELVSGDGTWNDILTNSNLSILSELLKDMTGVNTEFNQLFYAIKYKNLLIDKAPNLFTILKNKYSENVSKLFKYVLTDKKTGDNLFYKPNDPLDKRGVLNTYKSIDYYYPSSETISWNNEALISDKNFVRNNLLRFYKNDNNENCFSYLISENSYSVSNNDLSNLQAITPYVYDYESWSNYVDSITTYYELNKLLIDLNNTFINMYEYQLSNNAINMENKIGLLKPMYSSFNSYPLVFIWINIFILALLVLIINKALMLKKKKGIKKYEKN